MVGGLDNDNPELRAALEEKYGFNKPLITQLALYLRQILKGDFGNSYLYNRPVAGMIAARMPQTLLLGIAAAFIALIIGTAIGVFAARREGGVIDTIFSAVFYVFNALPSFWLALMIIIVFASRLKLFPSYGMTSPRNTFTGMAYIADLLWHMVLPLTTLIIISIPRYFRIAKTSVLQVSNEDFITTFLATGMNENRIFSKYILRNAILPTITIFSITVAYLVSGVVFIEIVFSWPGMGSLMIQAINQRDYTTLMGIYLMISVSIAVVMIAVDLVYALFDPRIRYD
jgi:peptide/nickel transport system permease protein